MEHSHLMKNVARTRDVNGKYIPGSNSSYRQIEPQPQVWISDGKYHSRQVQEEYTKESEKSFKGKEILEARKLERKGKGYESFRFTLVAPLKEPSYKVELPKEFSYKSVHVEDVYLSTLSLNFRNGTNNIHFTEGVIIDDQQTRWD
jgi:hypothetical protein